MVKETMNDADALVDKDGPLTNTQVLFFFFFSFFFFSFFFFLFSFFFFSYLFSFFLISFFRWKDYNFKLEV